MADPTRPMNGQQIDLSAAEAFFNTPEGQALRAAVLGINNNTKTKLEGDINNLSAAAQDLFFCRLNIAFNGGVKDPVQGRAYFRNEGTIDQFDRVFQIFVKDSVQLEGIMILFNNHASIKTTLAACDELSGFAKQEIKEHLQSIAPQATPETATPDQLRSAVETLHNILN